MCGPPLDNFSMLSLRPSCKSVTTLSSKWKPSFGTVGVASSIDALFPFLVKWAQRSSMMALLLPFCSDDYSWALQLSLVAGERTVRSSSFAHHMLFNWESLSLHFVFELSFPSPTLKKLLTKKESVSFAQQHNDCVSPLNSSSLLC